MTVLADLVQHAQSLSIYTNPQNTTSAWVLCFADLRFTLVVSEEKWRGFSGEGQLLKDIASGEGEQLVNRIKGALNWQESICVETLADELQQSQSKVATALSLLATRGLVGFDVYSGHYFHRVLPFDLSMVEALNPRIKSAKKLLSQGAVTVKSSDGESVQGEVNSSGVVHRVGLSEQGDSCTCPWFAKHQSGRGPCKHILALLMTIEEKEAP
ncbi:MAG: SWIM zinc finger domain-containing protein [Psychrosphaera sp.]|nr:SWIM zinc finger domain-containing protein [Psychrosphaera sp.]